jgi:hypothetical protein
MGKLYPQLDDSLRSFIAAQHMFFVATAPTGEGHVNCSPKGLDCFRILDPTTVAYLDLTGSGIETVAHIRQNERICIMFCAFEGPPKILRLYGRGEAIEPRSAEFQNLLPQFEATPKQGLRSIVRVSVTRIADSCGFAVPLYEYKGHRNHLLAWAEQKGPAGLEAYHREKNAQSIDGLPGLAFTAAEIK